MAITQIPWTTGSGNITLTYTGQGNGTITVWSSDNYLTENRSQIITVSGGGITRQVTVTQEANAYAQQYLTFVARENCTFALSRNAVQCSLDGGNTWTTLAANTNSPTVTAGNKIMWKGNLTPVTNYGIGKFTSDGKYDVEGNIMSLLYGSNFRNQYSLESYFDVFKSLFYGSKVVNAENLVLPATTLSDICYQAMFAYSTYLQKTPKILPAEVCTMMCYDSMFAGCSSLVYTPNICATTLASHCFDYMFGDCTSLVYPPRIIATSLADNCCAYMFKNCTSLTTSPVLYATTLIRGCYKQMFYGCTNLNVVFALFTTTPDSSFTANWLYGVAATGMFYKNSNATWSVSGADGVPSGWHIRNYDEDV